MSIPIKQVYTDLDGLGVFTLRNWQFNPVPTSVTDSLSKNFIAGENINAGRAVMVDTNKKIYLFDILNAYHYDKYIGISSTSVLSGEDCTVIITGANTTLGPGWGAGKAYYISTGGVLSEIVPSLGLVKQVAVGYDTNTIMIKDFGQFEII